MVPSTSRMGRNTSLSDSWKTPAPNPTHASSTYATARARIDTKLGRCVSVDVKIGMGSWMSRYLHISGDVEIHIGASSPHLLRSRAAARGCPR
eukprot:3506747-Rhodomonas_salina.1